MVGESPQGSSTRKWVFVTYNACSLRKAGRRSRVLDELNAEVLCLQGTRMVYHATECEYAPCEQKRHYRYITIEWFGALTRVSNHHCGLITCLHMRSCRDARISVIPIPFRFTGRIGIVRCSSNSFDHYYINLYLPPDDGSHASYLIVAAVVNILTSYLTSLSSRCIPFFLGDLNLRFGVNEGEQVNDAFVGPWQ